MAWLAIDKIKRETISEDRPKFDGCEWYDEVEGWAEGEHFITTTTIALPSGTIAKILGYELTFEGSPVEI